MTISPRAILDQVQPVTTDESVFYRMEGKTSRKISERVHINSKLTTEQNEQVDTLLKKHIRVFSTHDADLGDCVMIRHRINLIDPTLFKQKHRIIALSMIDEIRKHIEELL